jgi:dsDNA-binding SOS-regulon protein
MPRWLRQFTFNKINEFYKKEADEYDKTINKNNSKSTLVDSSGNINKQAFKEASPKVTPNSKTSLPKQTSSGLKTKYK